MGWDGEESCEHVTRAANYESEEKEKKKTRCTHSLYFMLRQSNRRFDEERLLRIQIIEQHLLYARLPAPITVHSKNSI